MLQLVLQLNDNDPGIKKIINHNTWLTIKSKQHHLRGFKARKLRMSYRIHLNPRRLRFEHIKRSSRANDALVDLSSSSRTLRLSLNSVYNQYSCVAQLFLLIGGDRRLISYNDVVLQGGSRVAPGCISCSPKQHYRSEGAVLLRRTDVTSRR